MQTIRIGEVDEVVYDESDCSPDLIHQLIGDRTIVVLGYGSQGRAQSLNLRDGGYNVIVGVREDSPSWTRSTQDGWSPGKTLFPLDEAARRGEIILYLLSDAGQKDAWPRLAPHLTAGKVLCLAHGFSIVYQSKTGVVPPLDIDVVMVAPKGSGATLRREFEAGRGLNAGMAIHQDATGKARERSLALAFAIGSTYVYSTTFERETIGDLVGERGTLLGAIYGLWLAQYEVLRENGFAPAEAFSETVEEATQSLYPLIAENGMDWMYANCSTTAQRGALDWYLRFRDAVKPVFQQLFASVARGDEAQHALAANSQADYRGRLLSELAAIAQSEMWRAGRAVRTLRPKSSPDSA